MNIKLCTECGYPLGTSPTASDLCSSCEIHPVNTPAPDSPESSVVQTTEKSQSSLSPGIAILIALCIEVIAIISTPNTILMKATGHTDQVGRVIIGLPSFAVRGALIFIATALIAALAATINNNFRQTHRILFSIGIIVASCVSLLLAMIAE
jgi:hypothetical protein